MVWAMSKSPMAGGECRPACTPYRFLICPAGCVTCARRLGKRFAQFAILIGHVGSESWPQHAPF
jgi:hypothetical protein